MTFIRLQHKIKALIAQNETDEALKLLRENLSGHKLENTVILSAAHYNSHLAETLKGTISWEQSNIGRNQLHNNLLQFAQQLAEKEIPDTKVFISYNREANSSQLADFLHEAIQKEGFKAFVDTKNINWGSDWAETILKELEESSYFVLLLSKEANNSETVIKEVELAYDLLQKTGKPSILPVRVNISMDFPLNARLHSMLRRIQQLQWMSKEDNSFIAKEIFQILLGYKELVKLEKGRLDLTEQLAETLEVPPRPVAPLEIPRGAVRLDSSYYIERSDEDNFKKAVEQPGAVLRIRGPRQYGKTSLLSRVIAHAVDNTLEFRVVAIDFQEIDEIFLSDLGKLLEEFCWYFAEKLDLEDECDRHWERAKKRNHPSKRTATTFIERHILREFDEPILLAIDEADRLFSYTEVSNDFFLLLRSWHEKSKTPVGKEWEKFRLCLCYSTEAKLAINDLNASPFNIGEEAKLPPFNSAQVTRLALNHGLHFSAEQLLQFMKLLDGQPYLVRRALYLMAKGMSYEEFIDKAPRQDGPFSDHLRHHLINIQQFKDCIEALQNVLKRSKCNDPIMATRLEATGLVKGNAPEMEFACELYREYFKGKL